MSERSGVWDVECGHCGYRWASQARLLYVTCPNCQQKTKKVKSVKDWNKINRKREKKII